MTTHAIASRAATPDTSTSPVPPATTPAPTALERDIRVKFASLPVPLRVSAGDQSGRAILLEGDLPWLALDTPVELELPSGIQATGRVQSFDIDVTAEGSARLRIFAFLARPLCPPPATAANADAAPLARSAPRLRLLPLLYVALATFGGYALGNASALRSFARSAMTVIDGLLLRRI
jgi:hypothetical protein